MPALSPSWDALDTRIALGIGAALVLMTLVALILRGTARSDRGRAFAADFGRRTLGWWILLSLFCPVFLAGGYVLVGALAITAWIAWAEFVRLRPATWRLLIDAEWAGAMVVLHFLALVGRAPGGVGVVAIDVAALVGLVLGSLLMGGRGGWARSGWRVLGFLVCVVPFGLVSLLALRFGTGWLWFVLILTQGGDILQYVVGRRFGRTPLAPRLSPRKTVEGLVGGVLATGGLGALLAPLIESGRLAAAGFAIMIALAGTAAGLGMSAAKRRYGAKDFGTWIPGQGGIMDRFDSICGACTVVFVWLSV